MRSSSTGCAGSGRGNEKLKVLDLFSAAAGGWSLGMHRAGFETMAACEVIDWRRALYQENNPHVRIYDDVCTLTADRLLRDFGFLPDVVVGSPPCQDISSANTKGKGVEGERSGLYFEATRIIGECRPRWFALENSANLRTRGADAVLDAVESIGYACWPAVVRARDVGANHERSRSWLIGFNALDADGDGRTAQRRGRWSGLNLRHAHDPERTGADDGDTAQDGCGPGRPGRCALATQGLSVEACGDAERVPAYTESIGGAPRPGFDVTQSEPEGALGTHTDEDSQLDRSFDAEMGRGEGVVGASPEPWADWNGGLAGHLRVDDGISAWVAGTRIAVGGPRGASAANLIVEAFGDAVLPQIPEAIGRAILRTEAALHAIWGKAAA